MGIFNWIAGPRSYEMGMDAAVETWNSDYCPETEEELSNLVHDLAEEHAPHHKRSFWAGFRDVWNADRSEYEE